MHWASLVTSMAKFDPEIVMEFYANAWPTEEGARDMRSWVRGQWIPFNSVNSTRGGVRSLVLTRRPLLSFCVYRGSISPGPLGK